MQQAATKWQRTAAGWAHAHFLAYGAALLALTACSIEDFVDVPDEYRADVGVEDAAESAPPPTCEPLPDTAACTGDPSGRWEARETCVETSEYDPLGGTCQAFDSHGVSGVDATLILALDGTYSLNVREWIDEVRFEFPLACFGGSDIPCQGRHFGGVCGVTEDRWCRCIESRGAPAMEGTGFWSFRGRELSLVRNNEWFSFPFCAGAGEMVLVFDRGSGAPISIRFRRVGDAPEGMLRE